MGFAYTESPTVNDFQAQRFEDYGYGEKMVAEQRAYDQAWRKQRDPSIGGDDGVRRGPQPSKGAPPLTMTPIASMPGLIMHRVINEYGLTPEAAKELQTVGVKMYPDHIAERIYPGAGGWASEGNVNIRAYPWTGYDTSGAAETLAHEFSHHWWDKNLSPQQQQGFVRAMESPENARRSMGPAPAPGVDAYSRSVPEGYDRWYAQYRPWDAQTEVKRNINNEDDALYGGQHQWYGTEMYAGLAGTMQNGRSKYLPPEVGQYYSGLFKGAPESAGVGTWPTGQLPPMYEPSTPRPEIRPGAMQPNPDPSPNIYRRWEQRAPEGWVEDYQYGPKTDRQADNDEYNRNWKRNNFGLMLYPQG